MLLLLCACVCVCFVVVFLLLFLRSLSGALHPAALSGYRRQLDCNSVSLKTLCAAERSLRAVEKTSTKVYFVFINAADT